ncbi:MAG UNVERIFIED_CONTAM: hypothetical protein LVR29_20745 [Microcystis novacekii LVE1205-3]
MALLSAEGINWLIRNRSIFCDRLRMLESYWQHWNVQWRGTFKQYRDRQLQNFVRS